MLSYAKLFSLLALMKPTVSRKHQMQRIVLGVAAFMVLTTSVGMVVSIFLLAGLYGFYQMLLSHMVGGAAILLTVLLGISFVLGMIALGLHAISHVLERAQPEPDPSSLQVQGKRILHAFVDGFKQTR